MTDETIIITKKDIIECYDKAGDAVAMWCILRSKCDADWRPFCFHYSEPETRLRGCEDCPWLEECGDITKQLDETG
ncbi:MAG: hypothetical protein WCO84_06530 [bacterium]